MEATTIRWTTVLVEGFYGAGDGIRTRDIDLGKVALYQLSYSRSNREIPLSAKATGLSNPSKSVQAADGAQ